MNDGAADQPVPSGETIPTFNVVDLFSGVGGFTLGFLDRSQEPRCRFVPRLMVDIDPEAREVATRNLRGVPYLTADIAEVSGAEIRRRAGLGAREPVHVLVGGPPCQGFSWLGKRALDDPRNVHLVDFMRAVKELRPMVALMENVPLIITSHGGEIIRELCDGLGELGYSTVADVVIASDYGVPQLRKRALLLAYRSDLRVPPQMPRRTHERITFASHLWKDAKPRFDLSKLAYVSVEEAIGDLPSIEAGGGDEVLQYAAVPTTDYQCWARQGSLAIFNHRSRAHSPDFLAKIGLIVEGGRNQDLAADVRFSDNYYSQAYARLHRNGIGQTITTYFGNPGSGRFMHYRDLRSITVREAARLQSFPDAFVFDGNHSSQMRHVGNAVPPLLARAVRDQIARDLLAAGVHESRNAGRSKRSTPPPPPPESPELRSRIMRAVPSKNTSAEMALRKALRAEGLKGYRLHSKTAPGNPDVLFPVERVVVFVDGCFWHGCATCYRAPKTHTEYWSMKVQRNKERDARIVAECKVKGWAVVRVWEHELKRNPARVARSVAKRVAKRREALSKRKGHAAAVAS